MAPGEGLPPPQDLICRLLETISGIATADGAVEDVRHENPLEHASTGIRGRHASPASTNVLSHIPETQHHLLTTLHVLFPAVLLPALDLLDRRRLMRYSKGGTNSAPVYQVSGETVQVVHLRAWHCTCAYFALRAAQEWPADDDHDDHYDDDHDDDKEKDESMEDLRLEFSTPPCRHLLASLLAEQWPALRAHSRAEDGGGAEALAGVVAGVE